MGERLITNEGKNLNEIGMVQEIKQIYLPSLSSYKINGN